MMDLVTYVSWDILHPHQMSLELAVAIRLIGIWQPLKGIRVSKAPKVSQAQVLKVIRDLKARKVSKVRTAQERLYLVN